MNCTITQVSLQASGNLNPPFDILWDGPGINNNNMNLATPDVSLPGMYTLTVSNPDNGCSETDVVEIFEDIATPAIVTQSALEEVDCNTPSIDLIADSPTPNVIYEWFDPQNITIGNSAVVSDVSTAGIYTIMLTNTENGCMDSEIIEVVDNTSYPIAEAGEASWLTCLTTDVGLNGGDSDSGPNIEYLWQGPGLTSPSDQILNSANLPGIYTLTVINSANGCSSSDQVSILQDIEAPTVLTNQPEQLDCTIETATLDGVGSSTGANFVYAWLDANGTVLSTDLQTDIQNPGTYTLSILNTINGCTESEIVQVTQNTDIPNDAILEITDPACFGDTDGSIVVDGVTGGLAPYVYSINGADFSTNAGFYNLLPGDYELTIQDANGCDLINTIVINPATDLQLNLGPDQDLKLGEVVNLDAVVNIPMAFIDTIIWTPSELITCLDPACLEVEVSTFNTMGVGATILDFNGCTATDDVLISIKKSRDVFFPTAFSPNDDGLNDKFIVFANDALVANIRNFSVYNRWGEVVHEVLNSQPNDADAGWDGFFKGKPLNPGVFIYMAEVEFVDGRVEVFQGDVTLVK